MAVSKRSVGIVGVGRIGSRCAYTLALSGWVDELILVDIDEKRACSEASDLNDCLSLYPRPVTIRAGGLQALRDCEIVAITAGVLTTSTDRRSLLADNARIVDGVAEAVLSAGFQGIFVIITNPCDVLAHRVAKLGGLDRSKVFATGTALDSARLIKELSLATGVAPGSIHGLVMGEHGDSQMIPWSRVTVAGARLDLAGLGAQRFSIDRAEIDRRVRTAAWTAVEGKGVAEYGVAACLARCVRAVFCDERAVIPLSARLCGEYGLEDVSLGVPALVGAGGVEAVLEIDLTLEERRALRRSYEAVRSMAWLSID